MVTISVLLLDENTNIIFTDKYIVAFEESFSVCILEVSVRKNIIHVFSGC